MYFKINATKIVLSMCMTLFCSVNAQTKDVKISRTQLWVMGELKIALMQHWGFVIQEGSRYDLSYQKDVNGKITDERPEKYWLQELWAGPFYKGDFKDKLSYSVNLIYQPQLWYPDETKSLFYLRNTVCSAFNLNMKIKRNISFQYRLITWALFKADQGKNQKIDNEFIIRNMFGVTYAFCGKLKASFSEEIFLKPTADEKDLDGTECFYQNAIWTGVSYLPNENVSISLKYVPFYTNMTNSQLNKTAVYDHYFFMEFSKLLKFKMKK